MENGLAFSNGILDTFSVLSSFNLANAIWSNYERYAVPKIEESTIKLRGSLFYIKDLTPTQAKKEIIYLEQVLPLFSSFKEKFENIEGEDFRRFQKTVLEFYEAIYLFYNNLQDIANVNDSYFISHEVLGKDWERSEDDHWDNY